MKTAVLLLAAVMVACGGDDDGGGGLGGDASVGGGSGCAPPCARAAFNMVGPDGNDVFLVDMSGEEPGEPVRVTRESVTSALPTGPKLLWAPSSLALAFDAEGGIYYVDLSGPVPGVPTSIVPEGLTAGWKFAWSADSRWIAFESEDAEGRRPVWAVDVSGGSPADPVALGEGGLVVGPRGLVPWHPSVSGLFMYGVTWVDLSGETPTMMPLDLTDDAPELAWSPTGDDLAVVYYDGSNHMGVVEFDGTTFGAMRDLEGTLPPQPTSYVWSPAGSKLAYRAEDVARIADLSQDPPVTFPVGDLEATSVVGWVGDDRIAVAAAGDVFTAEVRPSSTRPPRSATMGLGASDHALSPDHGALVFGATVGDLDHVPHVVELDGESAPRQLAQTTSDYILFSPSSTKALFRVTNDSMAEWMMAERATVGPAVSTGIVLPVSSSFLVWSPEEDRLLWRKDVFDDAGELYYTDLRGDVSGPPMRIEPEGPDDRNVGGVAWAPSPP